jgi:hypothetical protein
MQQRPSDSAQEGNVLGKCCSLGHRRCGLRKDGRTWWMMESPRSEDKSMFLQCFHEQKRWGHRKMHSSNEHLPFSHVNSSVIKSWRCIHSSFALIHLETTHPHIHTRHNMTSTGNLSPSLRRGSFNKSSRRPSHGADGSSGIMNTADTNTPMRHPRPLTAAELHLELEKEQEAVVRCLIVLHVS